MTDSWDRCIARARQLATGQETSRTLLQFYARLFEAQQHCHRVLQTAAQPLSGSLERDVSVVVSAARPILEVVSEVGPDPLVGQAHRLIETGPGDFESMLLSWWRAPSDREFFAKAVLQPYAARLAEGRLTPLDREMPRRVGACPFCGGTPQLSVLVATGTSEGGGRSLLCATCLTRWPFSRLVCANCGETDERQLGYFQSPAFEHLRVDGCESCHRYVKTVDLTRLGIAVPLVDEVAGAPLDLWAQQHGYTKIELNLVGL